MLGEEDGTDHALYREPVLAATSGKIVARYRQTVSLQNDRSKPVFQLPERVSRYEADCFVSLEARAIACTQRELVQSLWVDKDCYV